MGLLLSHTHLHGKNISQQSAFYSDRFLKAPNVTKTAEVAGQCVHCLAV